MWSVGIFSIGSCWKHRSLNLTKFKPLKFTLHTEAISVMNCAFFFWPLDMKSNQTHFGLAKLQIQASPPYLPHRNAMSYVVAAPQCGPMLAPHWLAVSQCNQPMFPWLASAFHLLVVFGQHLYLVDINLDSKVWPTLLYIASSAIYISNQSSSSDNSAAA